MRQGADGSDGFLQLWQQHLVAAVTQHHGVTQIVDILRGAGEVNEFTDGH